MSLITQKAMLAAAGSGGSANYWAMEINRASPSQYDEFPPTTIFLSDDGETLFVGTNDKYSDKFHLYSISTDDGSILNTDISVCSLFGQQSTESRKYRGYPENNKVAAYLDLSSQSLPEQEAYYDFSSGVSSTPTRTGVEQTFVPSAAYSSGNAAGVHYNRYYNAGSEWVVWNMGDATTPYFKHRLNINITRVGSPYVRHSSRYYTFGNYRDFQYEPCVYSFTSGGAVSWAARFYQSGLNNSPYNGGLVEDSTGTHLYVGLGRYDTSWGKQFAGCHKLNESDGSQDAYFTGKTNGGSSDDYQYQHDIDISADDSELAIAFGGKDEYLENGRWEMPGFLTFDESDFTTTKTMQYFVRTDYSIGQNNEPSVQSAKCFYVADGSLIIVWEMRANNPAYQTYIMITKVDPAGSLDGATFSFTTGGSYGGTKNYEIKNANQTYANGTRSSSNTETPIMTSMTISGRVSNNAMTAGSGAALTTTLQDL